MAVTALVGSRERYYIKCTRWKLTWLCLGLCGVWFVEGPGFQHYSLWNSPAKGLRIYKPMQLFINLSFETMKDSHSADGSYISRKGMKDKRIVMVQWVNRLQNNIFVNLLPLVPLPLLCEISGALHLAQPGLTAGWQTKYR